MFNQKNNELNQTRNAHLLKIYDELHKDIIIALLREDDKILIESSLITNLIEALDNYFTQLQKDSLCTDNSQELPSGTHEVLNEIEIFKNKFNPIMTEHNKQRIIKSKFESNERNNSDSFLQ